MPNSYNTEVIKYLKQKQGDMKVPLVWLGFEPYFIEAISNSSLNNLEEQLVFGTDSCTLNYLDEEENDITEIHYCQTDDVNEVPNHYKIKITVYKNPMVDSDDFELKDDYLEMDEKLGVVFGEAGTEYPDINGLYLLDEKFFNIDNNGDLGSYPDVNFIVQRNELIYIDSDFNEIPIAVKDSLVEYTKDNKKITSTYIKNKLKGV